MSYDLSTTTGKIRLLISDTDVTDPIFSDAEISAFYTMAGGIFAAAALAYGTIIRSRALLAKAITRNGYANEAVAIESMVAAKKDLEEQAIGGDEALYGMTTEEFATNFGETFESYRPGWREEGDTTVE